MKELKLFKIFKSDVVTVFWILMSYFWFSGGVNNVLWTLQILRSVNLIVNVGFFKKLSQILVKVCKDM